MGLMDKAKGAALQAKASAQNIAQQGQAKVSSVQQQRTEGELYRALGEAVYKERRRGGSEQATTEALNALDKHFAAAGKPQPGAASEPGAASAPAAPPPADPQQPAASSPPPGDFTLDNL
jgi:hypothetical protein